MPVSACLGSLGVATAIRINNICYLFGASTFSIMKLSIMAECYAECHK